MNKIKICDWCYKPIDKPSGKIHKGKPVCKPCSKLFTVHDVKEIITCIGYRGEQ